MFALLFVLFVVVPIVELYVIVQVAQGIGVLNTLGLLILVSAAGAWLVKRAGMGVLARIRRQVEQGSVPNNALIDGVLVLVAGVLLLVPGFVTDVMGLALVTPPVRIAIRQMLVRRFRGRTDVIRATYRGRIYDASGYDASGYETGESGPREIDRP